MVRDSEAHLVFGRANAPSFDLRSDKVQERAQGGALLAVYRVRRRPLPRDVLDGLQHALGVPVVEQYGSSEAALVASNSPPPGRSKPGTCGVPSPDTVRIVAEDGRQLRRVSRGKF